MVASMKILHITSGFELSFPAGVTNYVRTLAAAQAASGDVIHVVGRPEDTSGYPPGIVLKPYLPRHGTAFSLRLVEEDPPAAQIVDLVRREGYDIVHFHMALDLPLDLLRGFAKLGVPYVVSLHDYFFICPRIFMFDYAWQVCRTVDVAKCRTCVGRLDQVDFFRRVARRLSVQLPRVPSAVAERRLDGMRTFLGNARLLIAVSTRTAEIYREVVPDGRFVVEQIGNESANATPVTKTPSDKIRLTLIGTLNRMKGAGVLEELLRAVRRRDVEFHFHGRVFEGFERRLRPLGLICHGSYIPRDLPGIMAAIDVGMVLPIWEDNGPQVAMEFVNNRIPVLGTRRGGIPDIVAESAGLLFDPDDRADFARAVNWIERVTRDELDVMSRGMHRLKTPHEHAARVSRLYELALGRVGGVRPDTG